jgi:hypothetical protein
MSDVPQPNEGNPQPLHDVYKQINEESNRLVSWALLIFAGSLLSVLSNEYFKVAGHLRLIYLACILGWIFLAASIALGQLVTRSYLAGIVTNNWEEVEPVINLRFARQINSFITAVTILGIWLCVIVLLWIFEPSTKV